MTDNKKVIANVAATDDNGAALVARGLYLASRAIMAELVDAFVELADIKSGRGYAALFDDASASEAKRLRLAKDYLQVSEMADTGWRQRDVQFILDMAEGDAAKKIADREAEAKRLWDAGNETYNDGHRAALAGSPERN